MPLGLIEELVDGKQVVSAIEAVEADIVALETGSVVATPKVKLTVHGVTYDAWLNVQTEETTAAAVAAGATPVAVAAPAATTGA